MKLKQFKRPEKHRKINSKGMPNAPKGNLLDFSYKFDFI